jgi:hypothetical protein
VAQPSETALRDRFGAESLVPAQKLSLRALSASRHAHGPGSSCLARGFAAAPPPACGRLRVAIGAVSLVLVRIITRRTYSGFPSAVSTAEAKEETGRVLASTGPACMPGWDWDRPPFGWFDTLTLHPSLRSSNYRAETFYTVQGRRLRRRRPPASACGAASGPERQLVPLQARARPTAVTP